MRRLKELANSGAASAGAVLLPRVWSILTQWLVAATAGTAALTAYLTTTTRGSAAVSLVANALAPVIVLRRGAMRTDAGRAMVGAALVWMAGVAFVLTLAFEATLGLGVTGGAFTAAFAATTILGAPTVALWPVWQLRQRFVPLAAITIVVLGVATGLAALGHARLAAVTIGLGSAVPTLAMVGAAGIRRAAGYALSLARRAIPVSSMSFATALVYPLSLQLGSEEIGPSAVGEQLLFWPIVLGLGIVSQSIAARRMTEARGDRDLAAAVNGWLPVALALTVAAAAAFAVFRWRLGTPSPLPMGMVVAAAAFIFSDPFCAYFCPPSGWRTVAIGSVASALVVGAAVLAWPRFVVEHVSVCGPSAMVAAMRLGFITHPVLRRRAYAVLLVLTAGFVAAAWVR